MRSNDEDVLRKAYRFLRVEEEGGEASGELAWEERLAKKYEEQLYKEYCIADLSHYKDGKCGLRWRTETEVRNGKGERICGCSSCDATNALTSFEVNFAYKERGEGKNALVKVKLCPRCAVKLNWKKAKKQKTEPKEELVVSPARKNQESLTESFDGRSASTRKNRTPEEEWKECFDTMFK